MGFGLSLDSFVGEFVAVVLDEIFEFDPGEPDEWLTRDVIAPNKDLWILSLHQNLKAA